MWQTSGYHKRVIGILVGLTIRPCCANVPAHPHSAGAHGVPHMEQKTFVKAVLDYFGRKPGQQLGELQAEIKSLTPDDRAYFVREFARLGIEVVS